MCNTIQIMCFPKKLRAGLRFTPDHFFSSADLMFPIRHVYCSPQDNSDFDLSSSSAGHPRTHAFLFPLVGARIRRRRPIKSVGNHRPRHGRETLLVKQTTHPPITRKHNSAIDFTHERCYTYDVLRPIHVRCLAAHAGVKGCRVAAHKRSEFGLGLGPRLGHVIRPSLGFSQAPLLRSGLDGILAASTILLASLQGGCHWRCDLASLRRRHLRLTSRPWKS